MFAIGNEFARGVTVIGACIDKGFVTVEIEQFLFTVFGTDRAA